MEDMASFRRDAQQLFDIVHDEPFEQIQNSFSVGPDGVYIVTNVGLYKLRFNEATRRIELDADWAPTYAKGDLFYENDRKVKPGHLNNGSGTTPTLVDDRFVAIVDNPRSRWNFNVFRQKDGSLVGKLPLFEPLPGAVETRWWPMEQAAHRRPLCWHVNPFIGDPRAGRHGQALRL